MSSAEAYDLSYAERAYGRRYARAYGSAYDAAYDNAYERELYEPDISVVPGRGTRTQNQPLSPAVVQAAIVAAVLCAILAVFGIARVALNATAVSAAIESKQLTSQIEQARSEGNDLEVSLAALSNPSRIKSEAGELGMVAATETVEIALSDDVVVTDEDGTLSLSGSVAALADSLS